MKKDPFTAAYAAYVLIFIGGCAVGVADGIRAWLGALISVIGWLVLSRLVKQLTNK